MIEACLFVAPVLLAVDMRASSGEVLTASSTPEDRSESSDSSEIAVEPKAGRLKARGVSLKAALGANYAELFTIPTYAGELSLSAGGRFGSAFGYIGGQLQHGRTENGLALWGLHSGPSLEIPFGPLRLGGAVRFGLLMLERATTTDSLLDGSFGAAAEVGLDLVGLGPQQKVYLQTALRGDYYSEPLLWTFHASIGLRWDSSKRL